MDPRIQIWIRIHTKMSWIRNTAEKKAWHSVYPVRYTCKAVMALEAASLSQAQALPPPPPPIHCPPAKRIRRLDQLICVAMQYAEDGCCMQRYHKFLSKV
jgi:hypothetical protein